VRGIACSGWSRDTNADNTGKNTRDRTINPKPRRISPMILPTSRLRDIRKWSLTMALSMMAKNVKDYHD
jgi:hypothetical protein